MTVKQLLDALAKCDPDAEVSIYFDKPIARVMEIGGDSHKTKQVKIMTVADEGRLDL